MLGSLVVTWIGRARIPGSTTACMCVALWRSIRFLLGSHRGWVLGWSTSSRRDITAWIDWVHCLSPLGPFALLSCRVQTWIAWLTLLGNVLVYAAQRVSLGWLTGDFCVSCRFPLGGRVLIRRGLTLLHLRSWLLSLLRGCLHVVRVLCLLHGSQIRISSWHETYCLWI